MESMEMGDVYETEQVVVGDNLFKKDPDYTIVFMDRHSKRSGSLQNEQEFDQSVTDDNTPSSFGEAPPTKKVRLMYARFASSDSDPETVDAICQNVNEFSELCDNNGFKLSIESIRGCEVEVRLAQSAADCDIRKAFQEMDYLLKRKDRKQGLHSKLEDITHELSEYKKKVDQLQEILLEKTTVNNANVPTTNAPTQAPTPVPVRSPSPTPPVQTKYVPKRRGRPPREGNLPIRKAEVRAARKDSLDIFFNQRNLSIVIKSDNLTKEICDKVSEHVKGKPANPFFKVRDVKRKMRTLNEYIDFIQSDMTKECSEAHQKICDQFNQSWKYFLSLPTDEVLNSETKEFKEKFAMIDDIVGTIHSLQFKLVDGSPLHMCIAIVSHKIVCWRTGDDKETALKKLHFEMVDTMEWSTSFKLATAIPVDDDTNDCFVYSNEAELFEKHEKTVTWMKNNFICLISSICRDHEAAIPALYNISISFFERKSTDPSSRMTQIKRDRLEYYDEVRSRVDDDEITKDST